MKICNPLIYTIGVMMLTLHLVEWADVFMNGFTTGAALGLIASFIFGTYDVFNSIELDASQKEDDDK